LLQPIKEITIDDLKVGDTRSFAKTVTESDIGLFAGITGDFAPQHLNAEFAKTTMFGERIAHGMLIIGYVHAAMATLVSPGGITLSHEFKFLKPVKIGDTVTAVVTIEEMIVEKKILKVRTHVFNQRDELVVDGLAVEMMKIR
jgi:3-hydroxybutyryl-CoA dehydratase